MTALHTLLFGGAAIPVVLFSLHRFGGVSTSLLLLVFQVGLNLPHYFQTYALTYFDPEVRKRARRRLALTAAVAVALPIGAILLGAQALQALLAFVAFWAFFHITQQTRGLAGLYLRRGGEVGDRFRRPLLAVLFLSTAAVALWRMAAYGPTLAGAPLPLARPGARALALGAAVSLIAALARLTAARAPALGLAVLHTGALALSMTAENLSLALALATSWHALQYLGLTFSVQRARPEDGLWPRLARSESVAFFGLAAGVGLAAAALGAALPAPWGQAIYLPLLLIHYLTDGWLWQPARNPEVKVWLSPLVAPTP